jgi:hypothetical protein
VDEVVLRHKTITESTLLPLSLVLTLIGGVAWVKGVSASGDETATRLDRVEKRDIEQTDKILEKLGQVSERLSRIEEMLKRGK